MDKQQEEWCACVTVLLPLSLTPTCTPNATTCTPLLCSPLPPGREIILAHHLSYKEHAQRKQFVSPQYTNILKAEHKDS